MSSAKVGSGPARKAWNTIHKSARLTHIQTNIRMRNQKMGKLWIEPNKIGWIPPHSKEPIKKSWEQFVDWIKNT